MPFNIIILIMALYTFVQYALTRYVAYKLNKYDPSYFKGMGFSAPSMRVSFNITRMIFDATLPPDNYSLEMKYLILIVRIIYAATIPLFMILLII